MYSNPTLDIRALTVDDVPAALSLSREAGWNQIEADWRRLLDLEPEGVAAGWIGDELVATASGLAYGSELAWIGMVLVRRDFRRRGYGRAVFEYIVQNMHARGIATLGLDATNYGRPLYQSSDFHDAAPVTRWRGRLRMREAESADVVEVAPGDLEIVLDTDRAACGLDREPLLRALVSDGFCVAYPGDSGRFTPFAIVRRGREAWQIGPVTATNREELTALLDAVGARLQESEILMDVVDARQDQASVDELLARRGLAPERRLVRMTTATGPPPLSGRLVVAAAGLELG